jgi:polyhydroxyalkanoate synthesis regulator phasin
MDNLIKKTILTGLGAVSLTKEKAEKMVKDLIKEGEVSENEGSKFVKDMMDRAEENKKTIEKQVEKTVHNTLKALSIPSRKDISSLKSKIDKLEKKLGSQNN